MALTPVIYLTSPVFREIADNPLVSKSQQDSLKIIWEKLQNVANVLVSKTRFPSQSDIIEILHHSVDFIGCHISHPMTHEILQLLGVKGIATSSVGFNHIVDEPDTGILIAHTPGILEKTVADFTIAVILSTLRNLTPLHNYLWEGRWDSGEKWDLDANLNRILDNLTLGIVGLGEIGREVVRRLAPWGINIVYYDIQRNEEFEIEFPNLTFIVDLPDLFTVSDIISLHIPLNASTQGQIGESLLRKMKPGAILVNTARGPVIDFPALISLLRDREISIHLAFDVWDPEPISLEILDAFRDISKNRPDLRFLFIPHNASSDANTRARMSEIMLTNLYHMCTSKNLGDLSEVRLIPRQRDLLNQSPSASNAIQKYRIWTWWKNKRV
ncbi:MAG: 2-hydroxyacid dehydrogenase [Promethearchaeota archaeon]